MVVTDSGRKRDSIIHVLRMLSVGAEEQGHSCAVSPEEYDVLIALSSVLY